MKQKELKKLLEEAANPKCSLQRRSEIQCLLDKAVALGNGNSREDGIKLLLDDLYISILQNRPELLPVLFPVFAIICGDRKEGFVLADIDWSIVD